MAYWDDTIISYPPGLSLRLLTCSSVIVHSSFSSPREQNLYLESELFVYWVEPLGVYCIRGKMEGVHYY